MWVSISRFQVCKLKQKKINYIMAEQNDHLLTDVMKMLEVEPAQPIVAGPDIPALCEQLAILVSTGKCKEAIGMQLTHDQVKQMSDKDVMRAHKRYETYVGAKTTETLIDSFLSFATKALGVVVWLKDAEALQNELKNDYIITKEMSTLSGGLALRCGRMLATSFPGSLILPPRASEERPWSGLVTCIPESGRLQLNC